MSEHWGAEAGSLVTCAVCGQKFALDISYHWQFGVCYTCAHAITAAVHLAHSGEPHPFFGESQTRRQKALSRYVSPSKALKVWQRDNCRCVRCGSGVDLTVDHIVAVVRGGGNGLENLQTMCRPCNSSKGARA